ncbi:MAG: hypothetical protein IT440_06835 [Phycisphaeraceae bacterium]|nr:hypothetical protein [Phycisphaeraceae bacterium]
MNTHPVDVCDVAWNEPSADSAGSMPLGNGEVAVNAWIEAATGDLLFYIARTDAWDDYARLLKLGRVRVSLSPSPWHKGVRFEQRLRLADGAMVVTFSENAPTLIRLWVDAHAPVVRVDVTSPQPVHLSVKLEMWRTEQRELRGRELVSAWVWQDAQGNTHPQHRVFVHPDHVIDRGAGRVVWHHRNVESTWRKHLQHQGLGELIDQQTDPLTHRTFGGMILGAGLVKDGPTSLHSSEPRSAWSVDVVTHTAITENADQWLAQLDDAATLSRARNFDRHAAWWRDFFDRSYITFTPGIWEAEHVGRAYTLQRYITACAGRGTFPVKFNGSLFTVDSRETNEHYDADYRRWGGPYWFQNTRLIYWPLLASGDFDLIRPLLRMFQNALPLALARNRIWHRHGGAFFPETQHFWGTFSNRDYGLERDGKPVGEVVNPYIRWHQSSILELAALMLDLHAFTQDQAFARDTLLPLTQAFVDHYDQHYPKKIGKISIEPATSLETWHDATNPTPDLAGLKVVLQGLLDLPATLTSDTQRTQWSRMLSELPEIPMTGEGEQRRLLPAVRFDKLANMENPELYAVFPFRLFTLAHGDTQVGRNTFHHRMWAKTGGWQQDAIQAAMLGLTDVARTAVTSSFMTFHPGSRFPAFWGPNYDWLPDQCHGGVAMIALQNMLMQTEGRKILLLPAWPPCWNVTFKLHAPLQTVVEGEVKDGQLVNLKVTPPDRAADVVVMSTP